MSEDKDGRLTVKDCIKFALEDEFDEALIVGKKGNNIEYYIVSNDYNGMLGALERTKVNIVSTIDN